MKPAKQPAKPDRAKLEKIEQALQAISERKRYRSIEFYKPYSKQQQFHDLSMTLRERLLRAGNQTGKTFCGANEVAYHLTGEYPDWWLGRRWERPVKVWAASKTGLSTRDTVQKYLCGEAGVVSAQGSGAIPRDAVDWKNGVTTARGVADLYDTVQVKHKSGGVSILRFKSYDQGREKWQGETLDIIWFDEEPDIDIYIEGLTRITATKGMVFVTFTPLKGQSDVILRYIKEPSKDRGEVVMTIDDAEHIPVEERASIIAGYPAYQREARARGEPIFGDGKIFQVPEENLKEQAHSPLPPHWTYVWGIDFGIGHPFAAVLFGWDRDADILHVVHAFKMKDAKPIAHIAAMKPYGTIPVAWPQDGTGRESNGETVAAQYSKKDGSGNLIGLPMLADHATFEDGGLSTEAGIMQMDERMSTGKWKVAAHLNEWFEEYREYHRVKGLIVKVRDDIMSASRIGMMMRRYGKRLPTFDPRGRSAAPGNVRMATGLDYSIFE
jgi:phage terminase large subunit-like protein